MKGSLLGSAQWNLNWPQKSHFHFERVTVLSSNTVSTRQMRHFQRFLKHPVCHVVVLVVVARVIMMILLSRPPRERR